MDNAGTLIVGIFIVYLMVIFHKHDDVYVAHEEVPAVERNEWGQRADALPERMCKGTILMWTEACADLRFRNN